MKKILIIGAGLFQIDGIKRAKSLGYYVIATDGNAEAEGKHFADEFYNINVTDFQNNLNLAIEKTINAVGAFSSQVSLEVVSYIAEKLNLPGYKTIDIFNSNNKDTYFKLFKNSTVKIPKTHIYPELPEKLDENYIIKPSKGSGSRGVKIVNDIKSFSFIDYSSKYLQNNENILIQEIIKGIEITVDGVYIDSKFYLLAVSQEINDEQKGHTFSSELIFPPNWFNNDVRVKIESKCEDIKDILKIQNGPIHIEFKFFQNDLFLIDFSLRGGGFDVFSKIIEKTSGINAIDIYLNLILGKKNDLPLVEKFNPVLLSFIYPEKEGTLKSIKNNNQFDDSFFYKLLFKQGDKIRMPESGKERLAYIITWGNNIDVLKEKVTEFKNNLIFEIN